MKALKAEIAKVPRNSRGRRQFGEELRRQIRKYVIERHASGANYVEIGDELGVEHGTFSRWLKQSSKGKRGQVKEGRTKQRIGFRPVSVKPGKSVTSGAVSKGASASSEVKAGPVVRYGELVIEGMSPGEIIELVRGLRCGG